MRNPYEIDGPFVVAFSGGRTSAFMLRRILDAKGGVLPERSFVIFANTGLEHPGTLRFVQEVALNWGVDIHWLEYRPPRHFVRVDYDSAARNGEPFSALIATKNALPNGRMRFCTQELKIRTIQRYCREVLMLTEWQDIVGLRFDEPRRVSNLANWPGERDVYAPMFHAQHTNDDVMAYWKSSPFDLVIPSWAGNCVGCFQKRESTLRQVAISEPQSLEWWVTHESQPFQSKDGRETLRVFHNNRPTYADMLSSEAASPSMFDDSSLPCNCTD